MRSEYKASSRALHPPPACHLGFSALNRQSRGQFVVGHGACRFGAEVEFGHVVSGAAGTLGGFPMRHPRVGMGAARVYGCNVYTGVVRAGAADL